MGEGNDCVWFYKAILYVKHVLCMKRMCVTGSRIENQERLSLMLFRIAVSTRFLLLCIAARILMHR